MDLDDLRRIGGAAKEAAFRLDTLPQYLVPQEAEEFADWKAGKPMLRHTPETHEGLTRISAMRRVDSGVTGCTSWTSP